MKILQAALCRFKQPPTGGSLMRITICETHDIDTVEEWCAGQNIGARWQPLWCNGALAGWTAMLRNKTG